MKSYSVTTCLNPYFPRNIPPDILDRASDRGKRAHRACEAYSRGIPVFNVDADILGYLNSFRKWFDSYVDHVFFVELRLVDEVYGYHGKPDLGVRLIDQRCMIVDMKTPLVEAPTWKLQGSAYLNLARKDMSSIDWSGFMSLRLRPDGRTAKATVYDNHPNDYAVFLSALNVYRYIT